MKLISHNSDKLRDAVLFFAGHTKLCGLTKMMKLLYYLDFIHYRQTGKSVTGMTYYAWEHGPVPADVFSELSRGEDRGLGLSRVVAVIPKGERFKQVTPKKGVSFDGKYFTPREMTILNRVAEIFREADADTMVESSHLRHEPWDKTKRERGEGAVIDYDLALDGSPDQLDIEIIKERQEERNEMIKLFG